jgi:hypothetical protein
LLQTKGRRQTCACSHDSRVASVLSGRIAGVGHLQRLDIGSDMERLDIDEAANAVPWRERMVRT